MAVDTLALGAMAASNDLGLRVPLDVASIGFDDIQAASNIQLTTVRQHLAESGRWSAHRLLARLQEGEWDTDQLVYEFPLEIVERSTV